MLERGVHAGHRLVEHDQLRVTHERSRHFEQFALATGKRPGEIILLLPQQEALQQTFSFFAVFLLLLAPTGRKQRCEHTFTRLNGGAQQHVVHDGQAAHDFGQLEGADHAHARHLFRRFGFQRFAVEFPGAGVRGVEAGHEVEEGGFAGAVRADQRGDAVPFDLEMLHVDGGDAAEFTGDVVRHEDRVGLGYAWRALDEGQIVLHAVRVLCGFEFLTFGRTGRPTGQIRLGSEGTGGRGARSVGFGNVCLLLERLAAEIVGCVLAGLL